MLAGQFPQEIQSIATKFFKTYTKDIQDQHTPLAVCRSGKPTKRTPRDRNPSACMADWCTKTSSAPLSGTMKPNPFRVSNHLTVPVSVEKKATQWLLGFATRSTDDRRNALLATDENMVDRLILCLLFMQKSVMHLLLMLPCLLLRWSLILSRRRRIHGIFIAIGM